MVTKGIGLIWVRNEFSGDEALLPEMVEIDPHGFIVTPSNVNPYRICFVTEPVPLLIDLCNSFSGIKVQVVADPQSLNASGGSLMPVTLNKLSLPRLHDRC